MSREILFYCNAGSRVGFGHLRRCLFLASELGGNSDNTFSFAGDLSDGARRLIQKEQPNASIYDDLHEVEARVVVIDYMYDSQDPESYDRSLIASVADHAERSVVITSSKTAPPDLPADVVIGHLIDPSPNAQYEAKAGLKYAPVPPEIKESRPKSPRDAEEVNRVFIGFGNSGDPTGVRLALNGLQHIDYGGRVDVLLPSALVSYADTLREEHAALDIEWYHDIPSVPPLLTKADCMVGSYGHMTFEALALGVPTVVVGTKDFMVDYARDLEEQEVLICAGHVNELMPEVTGKEIQKLEAEPLQRLSRRALAQVDGNGLRRVAGEIRRLL